MPSVFSTDQIKPIANIQARIASRRRVAHEIRGIIRWIIKRTESPALKYNLLRHGYLNTNDHGSLAMTRTRDRGGMTERTSIIQEIRQIILPTQLANNESAGEMELAIDNHS